MAEVMVDIRNVCLGFGGLTVLDDVSLGVETGHITAVIGPNGAGKTSLFNCVSGFYRPQSGQILVAGRDILDSPRHARAQVGLARTFQTPALFNGLTVLENLMMGRYIKGRAGFVSSMLRLPRSLRDEVAHMQHAERVINLLDLWHYRDAHVPDLPYGLQKRVEFGRALCQEPLVLLLDEPMAGMSTDEKLEMAAFILEARREINLSVMLVEHDMGIVMGIADHVVVLDFGRKIADGTPSAVQSDPVVIEAYLGAEQASAEA